MTTNIERYDWLFGDRKGTHEFWPYEWIYYDDYIINDFTLAELKMLKRKMRYQSRNQWLNSEFEVVTLDEIIEMML